MSHQLGVSPTWCFISYQLTNFRLHQPGISPTSSFNNLIIYQLGVNLASRQLVASSTRHLANLKLHHFNSLAFHQHFFVSTCYFINFFILSTWYFINFSFCLLHHFNNILFCQLNISWTCHLSTLHFMNFTFGKFGFSSTLHFVKYLNKRYPIFLVQLSLHNEGLLPNTYMPVPGEAK